MSPAPVVELRGAALTVGGRTLWSGLDFALMPGELVAVLGGNGTGKTSLLRVVLGLREPSAGTVQVLGEAPARGRRRVGYVPQQKLADDGVPLRARDLVALGLDGHRWGTGFPSRARRTRVDALLASVGATGFATQPVSRLSGGEQQRLRIAQALASDPRALLCDEPLLSLDLGHQAAVSGLIDRVRRERGLGVLFVTHDINPVLGMVDRVLYLGGGAFRIGTPDEVLRADVLSELYGTRVDVVRAGGRIVVVGAPDEPDAAHEHAHEAAVPL